MRLPDTRLRPGGRTDPTAIVHVAVPVMSNTRSGCENGVPTEASDSTEFMNGEKGSTVSVYVRAPKIGTGAESSASSVNVNVPGEVAMPIRLRLYCVVGPPTTPSLAATIENPGGSGVTAVTVYGGIAPGPEGVMLVDDEEPIKIGPRFGPEGNDNVVAVGPATLKLMFDVIAIPLVSVTRTDVLKPPVPVGVPLTTPVPAASASPDGIAERFVQVG